MKREENEFIKPLENRMSPSPADEPLNSLSPLLKRTFPGCMINCRWSEQRRE